jgi:hypothetical protein
MLIRVSFAKDVPQSYDCKIKNFREEGGTGGVRKEGGLTEKTTSHQEVTKRSSCPWGRRHISVDSKGRTASVRSEVRYLVEKSG